jgi:hypothetical protein
LTKIGGFSRGSYGEPHWKGLYEFPKLIVDLSSGQENFISPKRRDNLIAGLLAGDVGNHQETSTLTVMRCH